MFPSKNRNYLSVSCQWYTDPPSIDLNDYKPLPNKPNESRPSEQPRDQSKDKKGT